MGTTFQGLAMAPKRDKLYAYQVNSNGLAEGAAVVVDSSVSGGAAKAPTGAAVKGFAGLIADVLKAGTGTVSGNEYNLQRSGIGLGLLAPSTAVTYGQQLVIADTSGRLRPYNHGVDADCDIVGTSEVTLGSSSDTQAMLVNLDKFEYVA